MKNILYAFVFGPMLLIPKNIFAQDATLKQQALNSKPQSSFFVELGGQSLVYAFNGDFRLSTSQNNLGIRVGIGYIDVNNESITTIPFGLNYLMGKKGKYFEIGIGSTFLSGEIFNSGNETGLFTIGTMFFGYRSQPLDGGINFRAGMTIVFRASSGDSFFIPYYPGLSFGYTFE